MRIIKNFCLDSNCSINCIALTSDSSYIAFGDSNKKISILAYKQLDSVIQRSASLTNSASSNSEEISKSKFQMYPEGGSIPKLLLDYHNDSVNAIVFAKKSKYNLVSGASDKCIIIWRIIEEGFTYEKVRILKNQSDVTDLAIVPNDEFIFASCVDNNIYVWRSNFISSTFDLVSCINNIHTNFITSICLDPSLEKINYTDLSNFVINNGIKFVSYADDGKLVLAETFPLNNGFRTNVIKEFKEFVNVKNKINSIQKKIDWSADGNWIVSVNHHYIKNRKVIHARLVNLSDMANSQVLIGHESAVLVAKFSPARYTDRQNETFSLLATSDKNGNMIIWKIKDSQFKVLTEISNFSEANITSLLWSYDGNYLFSSNSNGSVYILEFNEYYKSSLHESSSSSHKNLNKINYTSDLNINNISRKRIVPELISKFNNINMQSNFQTNPQNLNVIPNLTFNNNRNNFVPNPQQNNTNADFSFNPNQLIQDCLRCQKQKIDTIETKIINLKLDSFEDLNVYLSWENKIYDNYCSIQLRMSDNKILYHNKFENKLIRLFTCNNFLYVLYDTQNNLSVFTIFNTMIFYNLYVEDITFMELYSNFILCITAENKITVIDVNKKEKVFESMLDINYTSNSITTKISSVKFLDLERILIYTDSFNVFKNSNVKNLLLYNRSLNILTQLDNNSEVENIVLNTFQQHKSLNSQYNLLLKDQKFYYLLEQNNLIVNKSDIDDNKLIENMKINNEVKSLEEKLLFTQILYQKNEFIFFLKKYLTTLVKYNLFYRLIDFFTFYFKFNQRKIFQFLEEKRHQIITDLIQENIMDSEGIPEDVKEFIKKVISM